MRRFLALFVVLVTIILEGLTMSTMAQGSRSRPIEKAILNRSVDQVRRLIEAGDEINQRMFLRETPAIMAATADAWDIVLYLLEAGADPSLKDDSDITVAKMASDSRVAPDTKEGRALAQVREILRSRGLL